MRPDVFTDADQRLPERRVDDPPHDIKRNQQHAEAIEIVGVAVEIVVEPPEQRRDVDAGNAVIAAGEIAEQIAQLLQHDGGRQRQHQQRQAAITQQQPAGEETGNRRNDRGANQSGNRLGPGEIGDQQRRGIGADAEIGRMTERDDSGVAKNEIERQREQDHDQRLAAQNHLVGKGEIGGDRDKPRQRFGDAKTIPPRQKIDSAGALGRDGAAGGGRGRIIRVHRVPRA